MLLGIKINTIKSINGSGTTNVNPPQIKLKNNENKIPKNNTPIIISTTLKIVRCMLLQFLNGFKNVIREQLPRQKFQFGFANISIIKTVVINMTEYEYI